MVAFGPHSDVESLELAARLGCDAVLTKGAFSGAIGRIVETEGASAVPSKGGVTSWHRNPPHKRQESTAWT